MGYVEKKKLDPNGGNGNGGASPAQASSTPVYKRDLYSDLQKIEERGKKKKGFSLFGRK